MCPRHQLPADQTGPFNFSRRNYLIQKGAKEVFAYVVHAVLSKDAVQKIQQSKIKQFIVTNSIDNQLKTKKTKIKIVSIAPLLAEAINRISESKSVSKLFK